MKREKREEIIERIQELYNERDYGLLDISKNKYIKLNLSKPQKRLTILLVGQHSTGKSSFVNWLFGEKVQKTSMATETKNYTFIQSGKKSEKFTSGTTCDMFPFLKGNKKLKKFVSQMETQIVKKNEKTKSELITLIDSPGIIEEGADFSAPNAEFAKVVDLIFFLVDPIQQVQSKRVKKFLEIAVKNYSHKLHIFITKKDQIDETMLEDSDKDVASRISTSLATTISSVVPAKDYVPDIHWISTKEGHDQNEDLLSLLNNETDIFVQRSVDKLENDSNDVDKLVEKKLKSIKTKKKTQNFILLSLILVLAYTAASWQYEQLYVYEWLNPLALVLAIFSILSLIFNLIYSKSQKQLKFYSSNNSKKIASEISEFKSYFKFSSDEGSEEEEDA